VRAEEAGAVNSSPLYPMRLRYSFSDSTGMSSRCYLNERYYRYYYERYYRYYYYI
jgi:hypothetical protein